MSKPSNQAPRSSVSSSETAALTTQRGKPWLKIIVGSLVVLLLVFAAGLYFAGPAIASSIASSALDRTLADGTELQADSVRLSWSGPQRVEGLAVRTPDGHDALLAGSLEQSLWALIASGGKGDLGTLTLTGNATLNADAFATDSTPGSTELPTPPASTKAPAPIELGPDFAVNVQLDNLAVRLTSLAPPDRRVWTDGDLQGTLTGSATARAGVPATADLNLQLQAEGSPPATVVVDAEFPSLVPPNGIVVTDNLQTATVITFDQLATELLRLVPGMPEGLDAPTVLGDTLAGELDLNGRLGSNPDATLIARLNTPNAQALLQTKLTKTRLDSAGDNTLRLQTRGLRAGWPALFENLQAQGVEVVEVPELEVVLTRFQLPRSPDLRPTAAQLTARLGPGIVRMPGERITGRPEPARIETQPTEFTIGLSNGRLTLEGTLESAIDNTPAGVIDLDVQATDLYTQAGTLAATRIPTLAGTVTLTEVPSALLQPLAPPTLSLVELAGPALTASIVARAEPEQPTQLAIDLRGSNLRANGSFDLDGPIVRVDPLVGLTAQLEQVGPTLAAALGEAAPATLTADRGLDFAVARFELDLDALQRGGFTDHAALRLDSSFTLAPATLVLAAQPEPLNLQLITGDINLARGELTTAMRTPGLATTAVENATRTIVVETTTTWPRRESNVSSDSATNPGPPRTEITLDAQSVKTEAIAAILSSTLAEDSPVLAALLALDDRLVVRARPVLADGNITGTMNAEGTGFTVSGDYDLADGTVAGGGEILVTDPSVLDVLAGRGPGLARELLGPQVALRTRLTPQANASSPTNELTIDLDADRLRTQETVRLRLREGELRLLEPAEIRGTLTPAGFAALRTSGSASEADNAAEPQLQLAADAPLRITLDTLELPTNGPISINAVATATPLTLIPQGGAERTYDVARAQLQNMPSRPRDLSVQLNLERQGLVVVRSDLTAADLFDNEGGATLTSAGLSGTVQVDQGDTGLLDLFTGSSLLSDMLGPTANASLKFADFLRDGGTLTGRFVTPFASLNIDARSQDGMISLTEPTVLELAEITRPFSLQITPLLPVVGSVTKSRQTDEPATIRISELSFPIEFDLARLSFNAAIDPGTATLLADNDFTRMLRGSPSIGDSFEPFNATVTNGVLNVTDLNIPLGEFTVPARGTYDLVGNTENVFVQIPAAQLLAEGLGGEQRIISDIIGQFLNVGLRKQGTLRGANAWKVDADASSGTPEQREERIRDGIFDLIDRIGGE